MVDIITPEFFVRTARIAMLALFDAISRDTAHSCQHSFAASDVSVASRYDILMQGTTSPVVIVDSVF